MIFDKKRFKKPNSGGGGDSSSSGGMGTEEKAPDIDNVLEDIDTLLSKKDLGKYLSDLKDDDRKRQEVLQSLRDCGCI